jgi:hypothetical protein
LFFNFHFSLDRQRKDGKRKLVAARISFRSIPEGKTMTVILCFLASLTKAPASAMVPLLQFNALIQFMRRPFLDPGSDVHFIAPSPRWTQLILSRRGGSIMLFKNP